MDWRHHLERRLLAWPARFRQVLVRRELARLERGAGKTPITAATMRNSIRLQGLRTGSLVSWYGWAAEQGAGEDVITGALALLRKMAVQCDSTANQALMIALCSQAVAMSGCKVHVLTPDDNCTLRLEADLQQLLQRCGLRAAVILADAPASARREAYRAPVTLVSAREALRDYLDDRLQQRTRQGEISRKLGRLVGFQPLQSARMSGLPFGIIVDAERILIDQACEPMTIAGYTDSRREKTWAETALALAGELREGLHYATGSGGVARLTDAGRFQLERKVPVLHGAWRNAERRSADVTLALHAMGLSPGRHYRVVQQRVELARESAAPGGLLQLLQAREGVPVTGRRIVRGKLTFQRFFRRYEGLAALCGDTRLIRDELWLIYGLASFELSPAAEKQAASAIPLSEADEQLVARVARVNGLLGQQCRDLLTYLRHRRKLKAGRRLRRGLLQSDNQAGTLTAFSGRPE
jgi:preprotein translocase subunit SecA